MKIYINLYLYIENAKPKSVSFVKDNKEIKKISVNSEPNNSILKLIVLFGLYLGYKPRYRPKTN